jgi:hypothetical protein
MFHLRHPATKAMLQRKRTAKQDIFPRRFHFKRRTAALSNEWDSALALPPALDYFKMSEASAFKEQFSKRHGWNEVNRQDRLTTFARIINKYAMLRVSVSVRYDLFEKYVQLSEILRWMKLM